MIAPAEIQRTSAALGVSPDVVEHDYALGCFLHFLGNVPEVKQSWVFKGGTCLAKCYFSHYRFSEDLDFTLRESFMPHALAAVLDQAKAEAQAATGIRMDVHRTTVDVIEDDYGKESYEAKIYYEGVWRGRGDPRAIRVHTNRDETLFFPDVARRVYHSYSDAADLPDITLQACALEEVVAEKLRALAGQRRYAVARDLYDLWSLSKTGVDLNRALEAFPEKCKAKGLAPNSKHLDDLLGARPQYEANWKNNLEYLVPLDLKGAFSDAWDVAFRLLSKALRP